MSNELTPDAKNAVNAYLIKWLSILGLLNFGAIAAGLYYIFAILPNQALGEATENLTESITENTKKEVAELQKKLTATTVDALLESGKASERARIATSQLQSLLDKLSALTIKAESVEKGLENVNKEQILNAVKLISSISSSDKSVKYLSQIPNLKEHILILEGRMEKYGVTNIRIEDNPSLIGCLDMSSGSKPNRKLCIDRPTTK